MRALLVCPAVVPAQMAIWRAVAAHADVELHVLASTDYEKAVLPPFAYRPGSLAGATTHPATVRRFRGDRILWWTFPDMDAVIRDMEPDIVHVLSEAWGLLTLQGVRSGIPTIGHGAENRWRWDRSLESMSRRLVARYALRRLAGYVSWNDEGLVGVHTVGLRRDVPTAVAPAFVPDPADFTASSQGSGVHEPLLIQYVGRLEHEKGVDVLIEACAHLDRSTYRLRIVGAGNAEPDLRALAAGLGVDVEFSGPVPLEQVPVVMRAASIVVVPSREIGSVAEQFGRVVVEAMMASTPVVVSDVGALGRTAGRGGVVVPPDDPDALARALADLLSDPDEMSSLGERGRQSALDRYAPDRLADEILDVWRQAIAGQQ